VVRKQRALEALAFIYNAVEMKARVSRPELLLRIKK
jgi:hypothetical protein